MIYRSCIILIVDQISLLAENVLVFFDVIGFLFCLLLFFFRFHNF